MTTRADALAQRFEQANAQVQRIIMDCSPEQAQAICRAERCSAVSLACHVAAVHSMVVDWIRLLVAGEELPALTMDDINRANEARFSADATCTWEQALERLRQNGAVAAAYVRILSDAELDRAAPFTLFGGARVSVQTLIEQILIGDPLTHLASLQATLLADAQAPTGTRV
jgi:hypothetical protein